MKSIVCKKYGPPEVLEVKETDKPAPKDKEVLIQVKATSVTAADVRVRGFNVPPSYWLPARLALGITKPRNPILGIEMAGIIEAVGSKVGKFQKGDEVYGTSLQLGGYAEYVCFSEKAAIAVKPKNISFEEAATIPVGALTALYFLRAANIRAGHQVLIYGASGSVGTYALQLAKHFGAKVTAVCSSVNTRLVQSLGADDTIDYTREDFTKNGESYDIIFDAVGKTALNKSVDSLKEEGAFLHAVASPGVSIRMKIKSMTSSKRFIGGGPSTNSQDLLYLKDLVEQNALKPVIDRIYPLDQIAEAHRYVDTGRKKGNVAIKVA